MSDEVLRELASVRAHIVAEFSQALDSLEDRIDRKLQQKFGELQATSNAALHEVQLVREEFTKQADDAVLSAAAGVDAATWAHRRHQARSCRPEGGKSVHVSNAHCIPAGPGPIAESFVKNKTAGPGILKTSRAAANEDLDGLSAMSAVSITAKRESAMECKARQAKFANTFINLAGQQAKVRKLDRSRPTVFDLLEDLGSDTAGSFRGAIDNPRNLMHIWKWLKQPLHPEGNIRLRWDILLLLCLIYVCFTAPVMVCFDVRLESDQPLWWFEIIVLVLFILDVVLNFNTAYRDHSEKLVKDRWKIAYHYAATWFIIDLLAVIPFDYIQLGSASAEVDANGGSSDVESVQLLKGLRLAKFTRILRVLRIVKLLRLLKILKLPGVMKRLSSVSGENTVKMTALIGAAFLLLHLMACGFYYAAHMKHEDVIMPYMITGEWNNFTPAMQDEIKEAAWNKTWVGYANLGNEPKTTRYLTALYWSVYTLTTVGYGDISPQNDYEKAVAMGAMVIGVTVFAYFMGNTASSIAAYNSQETAVSKAVNQMKDFMCARHVPKKLANKITTFYTMAARRQVLEDKSLTDQLSVPLQTELMLFLYRKTLEKIPFFQGQDAQFITTLVSKLKMEYFAEDEVVVAEDDLGNVMYFVVNGLLEARHYSTPKEEWFDAVQQAITKERELKEADEEKGLIKRLAAMRLTATEEEITRDWKFYPSAQDLGNDYQVVGAIEEGEHFGEHSCLLGLPRASTVVALEFCELYSLSQGDLIAVYKLWPDLHKEFLELVKEAEAALFPAEDDMCWEGESPSMPQRGMGSISAVREASASSFSCQTNSWSPVTRMHSAEAGADTLPPGNVPESTLPVGGDEQQPDAEDIGRGFKDSVRNGIVSTSFSQPGLPPVEEEESTLLLQSREASMSNISPSKSVATAKVMRKAKMVMSIARMGGNSSDIASSNPVFQLLNEGADAKQDLRRKSLQLQYNTFNLESLENSDGGDINNP